MATSDLMAAGNVAFALNGFAARPIRKISLDRGSKSATRYPAQASKTKSAVQGWARAFMREGL